MQGELAGWVEDNAGAAEEGRVQEGREGRGGGEPRAEEQAEESEAGLGAPTLAAASGARGELLGGGVVSEGRGGGSGGFSRPFP